MGHACLPQSSPGCMHIPCKLRAIPDEELCNHSKTKAESEKWACTSGLSFLSGIGGACSAVGEACMLSAMLQVHSEERRGLDRRLKDLEIRLSGALSSKSLSDEEHTQRAQVCPAARLPPMPADWSAGLLLAS